MIKPSRDLELKRMITKLDWLTMVETQSVGRRSVPTTHQALIWTELQGTCDFYVNILTIFTFPYRVVLAFARCENPVKQREGSPIQTTYSSTHPSNFHTTASKRPRQHEYNGVQLYICYNFTLAIRFPRNVSTGNGECLSFVSPVPS